MVRAFAGYLGSLSHSPSRHADFQPFRSVTPSKRCKSTRFDGSRASGLSRLAASCVSLILLTSPFLLAQTVTVSPSSLSLGNQAISTTSNAKNVTLKNGQTVILTIASIATLGDYSQTNTCGTTLAAGAKCTISVVFT